MKRSILMFFVIGATLIFFGCSENNSTAPELSQGDQVTTSLAKVKRSFTGTCSPLIMPPVNIEDGTTILLPNGKALMEGQIAEWVDEAKWEDDGTDCWMLTGRTIWYISSITEVDGSAKLWGKAEIFVNGDRGKWEMSWRGYLTLTDGFNIVCEGTAIGKTGEVKGMVSKSTYTFNLSEYQYYTKGYVLK